MRCWVSPGNVALGAAALAVRLAAAVTRPPWHDEYFTVWVSHLPLHDLLGALASDSGPPLPYLLTRLVAHTGIPALAAARGISVLAGTAAVLFAGCAARRVLGKAAGLACAALLAFHPLAVAWSAEGRAYSLLLLASAILVERLTALAEDGRGAAGVAGAVALAVWSHGLGGVLAGAAFLASLSLGPFRRRGLLAVGGGLATILPWLPVASRQPREAVAWMLAAWQALTGTERALAPVQLLPPVGPFGLAADLPSPPMAVVVLGAVLTVVLVVAGLTRSQGWGRFFVLATAPAAALASLAALGLPAFYPGRGEALYLAPFLALVAAGVRRGWPAIAACGVLVAAGAATLAAALASFASAPPPIEARTAAAIRTLLPNGGLVVATGYLELGLWYELGRGSGPFTVGAFPHSTESHPGWFVAHPPSTAEEAALARRLQGARARGEAVAIVVFPSLPSAEAAGAAASQAGLHLAAVAGPAEIFATTQ